MSIKDRAALIGASLGIFLSGIAMKFVSIDIGSAFLAAAGLSGIFMLWSNRKPL